MQLQPPPPGAPGMFRCAANGFIKSMFENAGLKNVAEQEVLTTLNSGTADVYWNMMTEVAAPFVAALGNADHAMREKIKREVFEQLAQKYPDGNVNFDGSALLIYGVKV